MAPPVQMIPVEDLEFEVKWMGYDETTWEPAQNLKNAPEMVRSYTKY